MTNIFLLHLEAALELAIKNIFFFLLTSISLTIT